MQSYSITDVKVRIMAVVDDMLHQKALPADEIATMPLVDLGLSSIDMVNLMLAVEAEFDFTISQSDLTPDTFRTVETIAAMVVRRFPQDVAA